MALYKKAPKPKVGNSSFAKGKSKGGLAKGLRMGTPSKSPVKPIGKVPPHKVPQAVSAHGVAKPPRPGVPNPGMVGGGVPKPTGQQAFSPSTPKPKPMSQPGQVRTPLNSNSFVPKQQSSARRKPMSTGGKSGKGRPTYGSPYNTTG